MDNVAVLVPCYNEALTVKKVVEDYLRVIPEGSHVYVYDNNSSDGTAEIARAAGAVVRRERQQGKGNVIRRMFREIDAKCYILVDGDDTYPAEAVPEMIRMVLDQQCDMVVGDRLSSTYFEENKRPFHNFGNVLVCGCVNTLFKSDIRDIMTGMRAFSFRFVKTFPVLSHGFEIETEMSIHAIDKNLRTESIAIAYRDRPDGSVSKLSTGSDGLKVLFTIARLYKNYRPFAFFGIIAAILTAVAVAFFIPIALEYARTGLVPKFPTLISCGFVFLAALQSLFSGIILETIRQHDYQDFELSLIRAQERYDDLQQRPGSPLPLAQEQKPAQV